MQTYSRETCLCWLASAGISPDHLQELFNKEEDPCVLFRTFLDTGKFYKEETLPEKLKTVLYKNASEKCMAFWEQQIVKHRIQAMTIHDSSYPYSLLSISDAPAILFFQGDTSALKYPSASFVGSRRASVKGLEATKKIAEKLSRWGVSAVSGLAYGIDAAAHTGCLKGNAPTVAVLGCGLDQEYPVENSKLRKEIIEQGGIILSEYAPGEKPLGWHFPYRNRIISGLGACLILMEAQIRSGSMTSVQHALDQGKDVFVYPGDPESIKFEGNHQLLREGAIYFTTAEDIMEDMSWLDKIKDEEQNSKSLPVPQLSSAESAVLSQLEAGEKSFEQLCDSLSMPASQLNAAISMLQIQGFIQALPGKTYRKNEKF